MGGQTRKTGRGWTQLRGDLKEVRDLAQWLRDLIDASGVNLRALEASLPYGRDKISRGINGEARPDWPFVAAIVARCQAGADPQLRERRLTEARTRWDRADPAKATRLAHANQPQEPQPSRADLERERALSDQLAEAWKRCATLENALGKSQNMVLTLRVMTDKLQDRVRAMIQQRDELQTNVHSTADIGRVQRELAATSDRYERAQTALARARAERDEAERLRAVAENRVQKLREQLEQLRNEYEENLDAHQPAPRVTHAPRPEQIDDIDRALETADLFLAQQAAQLAQIADDLEGRSCGRPTVIPGTLIEQRDLSDTDNVVTSAHESDMGTGLATARLTDPGASGNPSAEWAETTNVDGEADSRATVQGVMRLLADDAAIDPRIKDWLLGSTNASARAPQAAVELLERSLLRIDSTDPRGGTLRRELVRALLWMGAPYRAEQAARAALTLLPAGGDRTEEVPLRTMLVHSSFQQARLGRAITEAQEAMRIPGLTVPQTARFEFLVMICRFTLGVLDPVEEPVARRMMALDDKVVHSYGLTYMGCLHFIQGQYNEAIQYTDRARAALTEREALPEWSAGTMLNRAFCLVELDRLAEAAETFEIGARRAERHASFYWSWYRLGAAGVHALAGRWDDALAEIKAGLDAIETVGPFRAFDTGWVLRGQAALIALHRGDLDNAVSLLSAPGAVHRDAFYGYVRLWAEARVHEAEDRPREALDMLFEAWVGADKLRRHRGLHFVAPDMARLAATLGDLKLAQQLAKDVGLLAVPDPVPSMRATAALCRALADNDADLMLSAERDYATAGRPLYQAYAAENAAVLLARAGRLAEARTELATALDLYEALEARWDSSRAELRLRQVGVRRTGPNPRRRPKSG